MPSTGDAKAEESSEGIQDDGDSSITVLFPWRHEPSPVPRLVPGTPESKKQGLLLTSKSQKVYGNSALNAIVTAYMFLNVPWYELFWISYFQDELSADMSWGFTQGVANLLSNLPLSGGGDHIPLDRIITHNNDDGSSEIDFCETIEISRSCKTGALRVRVVSDDETSTEELDYNSLKEAIPLGKMFQKKMVELYQSSVTEIVAKTLDNDDSANPPDEKQSFELRLKMIPSDYEFTTLYAIPYLSRRNAKGDPDLVAFYDKMLNETSTRRAPYLSKLRQEHLETNGYMESTIIAQCLVWCEEVFYVKNLSTGEIVQGREEKDPASTEPEAQKTPHLVRMERTVITKRNTDTGKYKTEQENWIITDIDDLLDGNLLI